MKDTITIYITETTEANHVAPSDMILN